VLQWLETRTGLAGLLRRHGREFAVPEESGTPVSLGAILVFVLLLQVATGVLLLVHFVPDPAAAFESVRGLMREVPYGWLVRLLHAHAANWMVAVLFLHLFRAAFQGAYKQPRELVWVSGCVLFLLVLASALTGYILPWSQMSYWATTVVTASFAYVPFVGADLVYWARGGEFVGDATYRRAFAAHVGLLPLLLLAVVAVHLALVRRAGLAPRVRRRADTATSVRVPFYPRIALRQAISIVGFSILLLVSVFFVSDLFFPAAHGVPADPFETPADVKPEWYFLWAYQLPRLMPEGVALLLQGVAIAALFALPFIDSGPDRHPLDRPVITTGLVLALASLVVLSVLGYRA
jgi:ubiquinol-cytochrome c reductase cytochrome b subunit